MNRIPPFGRCVCNSVNNYTGHTRHSPGCLPLRLQGFWLRPFKKQNWLDSERHLRYSPISEDIKGITMLQKLWSNLQKDSEVQSKNCKNTNTICKKTKRNCKISICLPMLSLRENRFLCKKTLCCCKNSEVICKKTRRYRNCKNNMPKQAFWEAGTPAIVHVLPRLLTMSY